MTEKAFEFCKAEDWADFVQAYPDAYDFLKRRHMYRQYLSLRLFSAGRGLNDYEQQTLLDITATIGNNPSRPQPLQAAPTPPTPPAFPNDPDMEFLAGCTMTERAVILRNAYESIAAAEGHVEQQLYQRLYAHLYPPTTTTPTPPAMLSEYAQYFSGLGTDDQLTVLEAAWQCLRYECDPSAHPCLDLSDEAAAPLRDDLILFLGEVADTVPEVAREKEKMHEKRREQAIKDIAEKIDAVLDHEIMEHFPEAESGDCDIPNDNSEKFVRDIIENWTYYNVPGYGKEE